MITEQEREMKRKEKIREVDLILFDMFGNGVKWRLMSFPIKGLHDSWRPQNH